MKRRKSLFCGIIVLAFTFGSISQVSANSADVGEEEPIVSVSDAEVDDYIYQGYSTLKEIVVYSLDDGEAKKITDPEEIREYVREDLRKQKEFAEQQSSFEISDTLSSLGNTITPYAFLDKRAVRTWTASTSGTYRTVSGDGGGTLSLSISESIAATLETSVGIKDEIVELGIGVSVTSSVTIEQSYSHYVTPGCTGTIRAVLYHDKIYFDIQEDRGIFGGWTKIGEGSYYYASGLRFEYYESSYK